MARLTNSWRCANERFGISSRISAKLTARV
jgi:hypothetical protein